MPNLNRVYIIGNLTHDAQLKKRGDVVSTKLNLVTSYVTKDKQTGVAKTYTEYLPVYAYGKLAQTCVDHLREGSCIMVIGRLKLIKAKNESQQDIAYLQIIADQINFLANCV